MWEIKLNNCKSDLKINDLQLIVMRTVKVRLFYILRAYGLWFSLYDYNYEMITRDLLSIDEWQIYFTLFLFSLLLRGFCLLFEKYLIRKSNDLKKRVVNNEVIE